MLKRISILFFSFGIACAIQFVPQRSYLGEETSSNPKRNHQGAEQNKAAQFSSGYIRTDTFDLLRDYWLQSQVLPISKCFRDGLGSVKIAEVQINTDHVLRASHVFNTSDCSGDFLKVSNIQPIPLQVSVSHEEQLEAALHVDPSFGNSAIISSFYSLNGCTGAVAQYDIFPLDNQCLVNGNHATILNCNEDAEVITMDAYSLDAAETANYPFCDPAQYLSSQKQTFQCSDQRAPAGSKDEGLPVYQTVQCLLLGPLPEYARTGVAVDYGERERESDEEEYDGFYEQAEYASLISHKTPE